MTLREVRSCLMCGPVLVAVCQVKGVSVLAGAVPVDGAMKDFAELQTA
jgi:hypothetical protein